MKEITEINRLIAAAQDELAVTDARRSAILEQMEKLKQEREQINKVSPESLPLDNIDTSNNRLIE